MGTIYQRGKTYWIKYYRNGKPYYESSKSGKKMVAKKLLEQREGEISQGLPPSVRYEKIKFEALIPLLEADYKQRKLRSWWRAEISLRHLKEHFGDKRVVDITTLAINRYIDARRDDGVSDSTINRELSILKRMLRLGRDATPRLVHPERIPSIPKLREPEPRQGFITRKQYQRLYEALPEYLRPVLAFGFQTGWRTGEIKSLRWEYIDMDEKIITLPSELSKNREPRKIYMDDIVYELIRNQFKKRRLGCPYVFCRSTVNMDTYGRKTVHVMPIGDFRKVWKGACKEAGIDGMIFHDLRRSAIKEMTETGYSDLVAMQVSGHKSRSVFDRYNIKNVDDQKKAAQRRMEVIARNGYNFGYNRNFG